MNTIVNDKKSSVMKGLSQSEVQERVKSGKVNIGTETGTKTIKQIILDNTFTFFNLVNFVLAALIIYVGSYRNLLFMGVVLSNIFIGIFQEIKAKRTIDKLSLVAKSGVTVIRDGLEQNIPDEALVVDDIIALSGGQQIPADAVVLDGQLEVNESLLTGESEPIIKNVADELLSGSFIISGKANAKITKVGKESYAGKISSQVKVSNKNVSEIQNSLNILIKAIALSLIPLGVLLFAKEYFILHTSFSETILDVSAALISMIPSGLVLLTSMVFVISVIKLSKYNTLVQDRSSVETLARVDVLCLDKTGTITEGKISLNKIVPLENETEDSIEKDLILLSTALEDDNPTMEAVRNRIEHETKEDIKITETLPFSSARKYSGASFDIDGRPLTLVMGAGSFIIGDKYKEYQKVIDQYATDDSRILILAQSHKPIVGQKLPNDLRVIAILLFSDIIRSDAKATLDYFEDQGVKLKIISGDDPKTAAAIARKAGLDNSEKYIDASTLKNDKDIEDNIENYNVFGRVTPDQKEKFVQALQKKGHTVAMTGDGVNDVLALKEADTSIAMASGSGAARSVADLVLIDSNFASLPKIVAEGRQQINNLQKSASLYISKTIFSALAILLFMVLSVSYPFSPIQLTLVNAITIGIPSFVLALEPNKERVHGRFFTNVLYHSLPSGIAAFIGVALANLFGYTLGFNEEMVSSLSVIALTAGGFILILRLCRPFNLLRTLLVAVLAAAFVFSIIFLGNFFSMVALPFLGFMILLGIVAVEAVVFILLDRPKTSAAIAEASARVMEKVGVLLSINKK